MRLNTASAHVVSSGHAGSLCPNDTFAHVICEHLPHPFRSLRLCLPLRPALPSTYIESIAARTRQKFAPIILNPKARIVVAVVIIAWLVPAIIWVFKLRPTTKPEQFLNENHPFQKAINVLNNNFGANSQDPG